MQFAADLEKLRDAREWAAAAARDHGLGEPDCFQVKLAVSEAVANAIQHGSETTADIVKLRAFEHDGSLVFEVVDTGTFTPPNETLDEHAERGRGLELVGLLMDEVAMEPGADGSLLRFSKRLTAA